MVFEKALLLYSMVYTNLGKAKRYTEALRLLREYLPQSKLIIEAVLFNLMQAIHEGLRHPTLTSKFIWKMYNRFAQMETEFKCDDPWWLIIMEMLNKTKIFCEKNGYFNV